MEISQLAQLISGGGVVAFAGLVYFQLISFRKELERHRGELEAHRKDESETRVKLVEVIATLNRIVDGDRERRILDQVRDEISGVHTPIKSVIVESDLSSPDDITPIEGAPKRVTPPGAYGPLKPPRAETKPGGSKR